MDTLTYERTTRIYDARHLLGIAVACGFIGGCGNGDRTARDRVIADFAAHTYDRWTFRTRGAPRGPAWGRWDLSGDGLRAVRPPGELDRPPLPPLELRALGCGQSDGCFDEYCCVPLPVRYRSHYRRWPDGTQFLSCLCGDQAVQPCSRFARRHGAFWFQSAIRSGMLTDGTSNTATFSERCLGTFPRIDPKGDYYLTDNSVVDCNRANPAATPRAENPLEQSGGRWSDGNVCYARYQHILAPNRNSCHLGGSVDNDGPIVTTASSRHNGGVNLATADGSIQFVKESINTRVWSAYGSIAGRDVVDSAN
jgi:prepilin-type processing-associated H-X9-DG protein